MKKLLAFVLLLILALGSCALAEEAEPVTADAASLAGEWYQAYVVIGEEREMIPQASMTLTLNEDGTGAVVDVASELELSCVWSVEDNAVTLWEDGTNPEYGLKFQFDGLYLRFMIEEMQDFYYLFKRDYGPEVMENNATLCTGITAEDFNGRWSVCEALNDDGMNHSEEALEAMRLSNYPYSFEPSFENGVLTYHREANGVVQTVVAEVTVVDDAIVIAHPHHEEGTVTMRMHTDGYMSMAYETPDRYYVLFYNKN